MPVYLLAKDAPIAEYERPGYVIGSGMHARRLSNSAQHQSCGYRRAPYQGTFADSQFGGDGLVVLPGGAGQHDLCPQRSACEVFACLAHPGPALPLGVRQRQAGLAPSASPGRLSRANLSRDFGTVSLASPSSAATPCCRQPKAPRRPARSASAPQARPFRRQQAAELRTILVRRCQWRDRKRHNGSSSFAVLAGVSRSGGVVGARLGQGVLDLADFGIRGCTSGQPLSTSELTRATAELRPDPR
jgi:hypothetical protein